MCVDRVNWFSAIYVKLLRARARSGIGKSLCTHVSGWSDSSPSAVSCRRNEVAVFCFTAPQLLLMQLPVVGPLLFLPASAAAACLADYLHRLPYNAAFQYNPSSAGTEVPMSSTDRGR